MIPYFGGYKPGFWNQAQTWMVWESIFTCKSDFLTCGVEVVKSALSCMMFIHRVCTRESSEPMRLLLPLLIPSAHLPIWTETKKTHAKFTKMEEWKSRELSRTITKSLGIMGWNQSLSFTCPFATKLSLLTTRLYTQCLYFSLPDYSWKERECHVTVFSTMQRKILLGKKQSPPKSSVFPIQP